MPADTDLIKLYSNRILALAADIPHHSRLDAPTATVKKRSPLCGSAVTVDITVEDGRVSGFGQDVKACALGQASSSILARHIRGTTPEELRILHREMVAMLKEGGPPPTGERWEEMKKLEPIKDYPARHASTLLVFDAVIDCLDQIENR